MTVIACIVIKDIILKCLLNLQGGAFRLFMMNKKDVLL